jgi:hypothetical protein
MVVAHEAAIASITVRQNTTLTIFRSFLLFIIFPPVPFSKLIANLRSAGSKTRQFFRKNALTKAEGLPVCCAQCYAVLRMEVSIWHTNESYRLPAITNSSILSPLVARSDENRSSQDPQNQCMVSPHHRELSTRLSRHIHSLN